MATYHLLHIVHRLRLPGYHVESGATAYVGCRLRLWVGFGIVYAGWDSLMGCDDDATVQYVHLVYSLHTRQILTLYLPLVMGATEVAYGPGVPYLLSFFYLRHELGLRAGMFLSAAPLANTFAGALAYGITSGSPKLAKWRVLFLVEGLPTVAMSVVAWFFLPDSPEKARFLTEEEKAVARARGVRQAGAATRIGGINFKEFFQGLVDLKGWILGVSMQQRVP